MRKKKPEAHVNHERWLVSYADFITLLFAFFVVMFSVSQVDSKQVGRFTESFAQATGLPLGGVAGEGVLPGAKQPAPTSAGVSEFTPPELRALSARLQELEASDAFSGVKIIRRKNEIVLRLADGVLFGSGDDALKEPALRVLRVIADELRERHLDIRVEGHTDNVPIHTVRFRSNWDLSTARATAVVVELAGTGRIAPARLSAAGYGEFHPLAPNTTIEERTQNRRVDLVVSLTSPPTTP